MAYIDKVKVGDTTYDVRDAGADVSIAALGMVDYGYGTPADATSDLIPSVKRTGTRVVLNGTVPSSGSSTTRVRVSLTTPDLTIYVGNVPQSYRNYGIKLIDGHVYRVRAHYISGTESATTHASPRFFNGTNGSPLTAASTHSVDPATGDQLSQFTYVATTYLDGVHVGLLVTRDNVLDNYTVEVTVEDITDGAKE